MNVQQITEKCGAFFDKNGIETVYLGQEIERHFESKKEIIKLLGLGEDNDFRTRVEFENTLDARPDLQAFFTFIEGVTGAKYKVHDINFMKEGKKLVKVSKIVDQYWKEMKNYCEEDLTGGLAKGREKFIEMYYACREKKDIKHTFLCSFGDLTRSVKTIIISANPFDIITASSAPYATFSTCIRVDGEYFNTVFDYMASNCVLISYVSDGFNLDKKIGRQFIYMHPNAMAQTRLFGAMIKEDEEMVRKFIWNKVGGTWVCSKDTPSREKNFVLERTPYIDNYGTFSHIKNSKVNPFIISCGFCMSCGKKLTKDNGKAGMCGNCAAKLKKCIHCSRLGKDFENVEKLGGYICPACKEKLYKKCKFCGDADYYVNMINIENEFICSKCVKKHVSTCSCCSIYHYKDSMRELNGNYYCKKCKKYITKCSMCGNDCDASGMFRNNGELFCLKCYNSRRK